MAGDLICTDTTILLGDATHRWKRLFTQGTANVAGDYATGTGWGTTATVGSVTGSDDHGSFVVTASGAGLSTANLTITLTFKDGTWTNAPYCLSKFEATNDPGISVQNAIATETTTATTLVITLTSSLAPTTGKTFTFSFICIGA